MAATTIMPGVESGPLPRGLDDRSQRPRVLQIAVVLVIVGLVAVFAPGLGDVRERIEGAQPGWLCVAVVLELLSCLSYVLMIRPIFCAGMSRRTSYQLGMPGRDIARRTVAFFVLKSAVNFVAVAAVGIAMWLGAGPGLPVATAAAAAILAYRVILLWLPLILGAAAFVSLRRGLQDPERPDLCDPFRRPQVAL